MARVVGLTRPELDALYGPGEAMQSGWYYDFGGFGLILADCDLILDIDPEDLAHVARVATASEPGMRPNVI